MEHIFSEKHREHVSRRLQYRIVVFLVIGIFLLGLFLYDLLLGEVSWPIGIGALIVGCIIGYMYGRLTRIIWHESREQIVMQVDIVYFILIGGYIALSIARETLLKDFLSGAALLAVSYAVAAGILLGRFLGVHGKIMHTLRTKKS